MGLLYVFLRTMSSLIVNSININIPIPPIWPTITNHSIGTIRIDIIPPFKTDPIPPSSTTVAPNSFKPHRSAITAIRRPIKKHYHQADMHYHQTLPSSTTIKNIYAARNPTCTYVQTNTYTYIYIYTAFSNHPKSQERVTVSSSL